MIFGSFLVDFLNFLELIVFVDFEYRVLLGVRLLDYMYIVGGFLGRKLVLFYVFLWTVIKLGYIRMYSMGDLD